MRLTKRDRDLLRLLYLGFDYQRISEEFGISYQSVKNQAFRACKRYHASNMATLVLRAVVRGDLTRDTLVKTS